MWGTLSNVIRHPNCNLIELELYNAGINDTGAKLLGAAISGSSMKALNLGMMKHIGQLLQRL